MRLIGHPIKAFAVAGVLCLGLSRSGVAQTADRAHAGSMETVHVTAYRVKQPARVPTAKSETRGRAPSRSAIWIPGFWDLQGDPNSGPRAGWVWVVGRWTTPPMQHARWDPAHWGWSNDWWSWVPGHWVARGPHGYQPSLTSDKISQEVSPQFENR
jgi:hypothetical protein